MVHTAHASHISHKSEIALLENQRCFPPMSFTGSILPSFVHRSIVVKLTLSKFATSPTVRRLCRYCTSASLSNLEVWLPSMSGPVTAAIRSTFAQHCTVRSEQPNSSAALSVVTHIPQFV